MAKSLTEPPPSSSVANALLESASRATAAPGQSPVVRIKAAEPTKILILPTPAGNIESANVTREYVLTPSADDTSSELTVLFRKATSARVNNSIVLRCLLQAARHAIKEIEHEAHRIGPLQLPPKGDDAQRQAFEDCITAALVAGLRACRVYHSDHSS